MLVALFTTACAIDDIDDDASIELAPSADGKEDGAARAVVTLSADAPAQRLTVRCNEWKSCDLRLAINGGSFERRPDRAIAFTHEAWSLEPYVIAIARREARAIPWQVPPEQSVDVPVDMYVGEVVVRTRDGKERVVRLNNQATVWGFGAWWDGPEAKIHSSYILDWVVQLHSDDPKEVFEMTVKRSGWEPELSHVQLTLDARWN